MGTNIINKVDGMRAIAYIDESGDHDLTHINQNFPVLTVAAFVIREDDIPAFEDAFKAVKNIHFGNEAVILHSRDIRKQIGPFKGLQDKDRREQFYADFNALVAHTPCHISSVTIRKELLIRQYAVPDNPYSLALEMLLERLVHIGQRHSASGQSPMTIQLIAESRGRKVEDPQLVEAYNYCCKNGTGYVKPEAIIKYCPELNIITKQSNSCGLQMADMLAYPIARYALGNVDGRTWNVIRPKLYAGNTGNIAAYGVKIFP